MGVILGVGGETGELSAAGKSCTKSAMADVPGRGTSSLWRVRKKTAGT